MLTKSFFKHCCSHKGSLVLALAMTASHIGSAAASVPDDDQSRKSHYDWATWKFLSTIKSEMRLERGDAVKVRFVAADGGVREVPPLIIKTAYQETDWLESLPYLVRQADVGVRMAGVDVNGRYPGSIHTAAMLHYYDLSPGTYVRAITEIHHVKGGVTALPELATRNEGSMNFQAPLHVKRGSNFTIQAGLDKGKVADLTITVIDSAVGELVQSGGGRVDENVRNFELTSGVQRKGPLMLVANAHLDGHQWYAPRPLVYHTVELYDFDFPQGVASYKAGVKVLQPKDNALYECRPFPAGDYCRQWSATDVQFEPGVGSNWRDAWIRLP